MAGSCDDRNGADVTTRPASRGTRVAICVATFRRPLLLRSLLESLAGLAFKKELDLHPFIVVVDNDADGGAEPVVVGLQAQFPFPLRYVIEPRRGIPYARNTAVRAALEEGAEFVAFIDDDETASPRWIDELVHVQRHAGADVVSGPVRPRFAPGVAPWIADGGFFAVRHYQTGASVPMAATNNSLVAASLLASPFPPFDPRFGLSGVDDSHFFLRVRLAGAKMVWAEMAVVEEFIPATRANTAWLLRRAFRIGNGLVVCTRALLPPARWIVPRLTGAVARISVGLIMLLWSTFRGRASMLRSLQTIANGLGALAALAGFRYEEYRVVHGH